MKSLQTIQKTFGVFQVLAKVGMILSFVWAGLSALGLLCGIVWYYGGSIIGVDWKMLMTLTVTESLTEMIGVLLVDMILALTDGTLLVYVLRYFKTEQKDGTPFTHEGAEQVLRLGILTIVLPLVSAIVSALICELLYLPQSAVRDWDNLSSLTAGIVLILVSLIFRYGAELEEKQN